MKLKNCLLEKLKINDEIESASEHINVIGGKIYEIDYNNKIIKIEKTEVTPVKYPRIWNQIVKDTEK